MLFCFHNDLQYNAIIMKKKSLEYFLIILIGSLISYFASQTSFDKPSEKIDEKIDEKIIVTKIIDGDTVELNDGRRVRYIGIDTPEKSDCYFKEASNKNKELVEGKEVRLEKDKSDTDRYGRLLRYVYVDEFMVNDVLVKEGYAKAYKYPPDVKYSEEFFDSEQLAKNDKLGLWSGACDK